MKLKIFTIGIGLLSNFCISCEHENILDINDVNILPSNPNHRIAHRQTV